MWVSTDPESTKNILEVSQPDMQCNSSPEYHAITTAEGGNYCLVEKYSTDMLGNFPGSGPISKIKTRKKYDLFFKQNSITVHPLQTFVIQIIIFLSSSAALILGCGSLALPLRWIVKIRTKFFSQNLAELCPDLFYNGILFGGNVDAEE